MDLNKWATYIKTNNNTNISIKAQSGDFNAKNTIDHQRFSNKESKNHMLALFTACFFLSCLIIPKKANHIKTYNRVQTGPNTQLGGLSKDLSSVKYQVSTEALVKNHPTTPTSKQIAIENAINFKSRNGLLSSLI